MQVGIMKVAVHLQNLSIEDLQNHYEHYELYKNLISSLNLRNDWRKILDFLRGNHCCRLRDDNFNSAKTPAETILDELIMLDADVEKLCIILKECNLMGALSLLLEHEPLEITKQPGDPDDLSGIVYVKEFDDFELECLAEGIPMPTYQWYKDGILLDGRTSSMLLIEEFLGDDCGEYYCCVKQVVNGSEEVQRSNRVTVKQQSEAPAIIFNLPTSKYIKLGEELSLTISAYAFPTPDYSWYRGNTLLDCKTSFLKIDEIEMKHEGEYRCCIQNEVGEIWSTVCKLSVYFAPSDEILEKNQASAKFALLIGNSKYEHYKQLVTPENDLLALTEILKRLGFEVITLQDLSLIEMINAVKWFCKALPAKAYAFFYFVGHGFKLNNRYMMPIDCPPVNALCHSDCFSDAFLEKEFMESDTQLIVIVFDMCLKVLKGNAKLENIKERVCEYTRNMTCSFLQCFATSSQLESYETAKRDHGLYFTHLRKFLEKNIPVTSVFLEAHREFAKYEGARQKPCVYFDDAHRFCLTDPVFGSSKLKEKIQGVSRIPSKQKLKFNIGKYDMAVNIRPYKGCFLNAVELWLPLSQWKMTIDHNALGMKQSEYKIEEGAVVLTLYDLQKAKFDLCVSIYLLKENESNESKLEIVDSAIMDLGSFMIMPARLWYNGEEADLKS